MPKLRMIFALLFATIAGGAVLLWPQRPLWTKPIPACHELVHYSLDGKSLVVAESFQENRRPEANASLVHYDLPTGRELKRIPLTFPDQTFISRFWLTPDCETIVCMVATASKRDPRASNGNFSLVSIDVISGQRLNGPLSGEAIQDVHFSHDRKWFCFTKPDASLSDIEVSAMSDFSRLKSNIDVVSTADFRDVHSLSFNPSLRTFHEFCFFEDDSKMAILSTKWPGKTMLQLMNEAPEKLANLQQVLEVLDLQTGKVIQTCDMPLTHKWHKVVKADGQQFFVQGMNLKKTTASECYTDIVRLTFDGKEPVGVIDPTLSSYSRTDVATNQQDSRTEERFGDDWSVQLVSRDRRQMLSEVKGTVEWIDSNCGTKLMDWFLPMNTICVIDCQSGAKRLVVPYENAPQILVSNDGQYLAHATYEKPGLALWNANPNSCWPYAILTGTLTAFLVLALLRARRRSREIAAKLSS